jgi:subtilisin family serine protease
MDHGVGTPALYLDCMEWTFAPYPPGGDPFRDGRPDLAPHVVNNSWGCPPSEGCDPETLRDAFARMRQAGIWQVAAAGNSGPNCTTVKDPPAIYEEAFSVGAVNSSRTLAFFSSRGPVTIDGSDRLKPNVSAPGEGVRSATRGGGYGSSSGTSMAAPHVAGVSALLWSANETLRGLVDLSRCVLERSASTPVRNYFNQTCGGMPSDQYPNALAGWGIVDAEAALELPETDGDEVADACDCAAQDGGVFDEPVEVSGTHFDPAELETLLWNSQAPRAGSATVYDLLRGDVAGLAADGGISGAECLADGLTEAEYSDAAVPAAGRGFYYLPRARNACATAGYGAGSGGTERENPACAP